MTDVRFTTKQLAQAIGVSRLRAWFIIRGFLEDGGLERIGKDHYKVNPELVPPEALFNRWGDGYREIQA